jgi:hopanoid biosynthesis associated RND transporter like protein HpnN
MSVQQTLIRLADLCRRRAVVVVLAGLACAVLSVAYAARHRGVTTDTSGLFSEKLAWRQSADEFNRQFPQFDNLLVVAISAAIPEEAEETAADLAAKLKPDTRMFNSVTRPDASPFLRKEGLLFLDTPDLSKLMDQTITAQPFIGQLVADPSARGLFAALGLLGIGATKGDVDLEPYFPSLRGFDAAMRSALEGHPQPLSWQKLLGGGLSDLAGKYRFVLAQPKLNFGALQPGGEATQIIRTAAADLPFVKSGQAHAAITGQVALSDEEFATVAEGAVLGLVGSLILITLWLFLAVKTWRLIVPILLTLVLGLTVTLFFAALAVGTLNLISVGFGILFVGIAVDFAIQFSVRFRERRHEFPDFGQAMRQTAARTGAQILVASVATAAGFLAFVPTDFVGVAELGLIAGMGMLIAFVCTLTFLPAAITLFHPPGEKGMVGFHWAVPLDPLVALWRRPILVGFGALAVAGIALSPSLAFDSNPLDTKNQHTEAMRTLRDLLSSPVTNPYTIDILAPNMQEATALAAKLRVLSTVDSVRTIASFIPAEQEQKLAVIQDASGILEPTLTAPASAAPVKPDDIRLAAKTALQQIEPSLPKLAPDHPLRPIAADLKNLGTASDATVMSINQSLTRFLPSELDQLRTSLDAEPVSLDTMPPELKRDWVLPDGRARVQVLPKIAASRTSAGLASFVREVTAVAPNAGGPAVTIQATSATIVGAFRSAAAYAVVAIAVILFIALRRLRDVLLVLAPLILSGLMTLVVAVLLPLPLNYANIIALPLLLGVGVSFNIYFVMNWRVGRTALLGSATARAIVFSALTTSTAFGSLALSHHPGTASMGGLLLISLGCTLIASLVFIPALLASFRPPILR